MSLQQAAESTKDLSNFLCKPIEEIWLHHTSDAIKEQFSLDEVLEYLAEHYPEGF